MSGTLSATTLNSLAPILKDITSVANLGSTGYNIYNQWQQTQYQNKLRDLASNPQKMAQFAAQFTQPLNAGLQRGVANEAQGYLASRGLSDSPQISEQVEAQAIAPYIQQNQNQGYQNALQALQVGGGAIPPAFQQQNSMAALIKAFSSLPGVGGGGSTGLPSLADYIRTMGTLPPQLSLPAPSGPAPGPIDTSGWDWGAGSSPDLSVFTTPPPDVTYQPDAADYGILANPGGGGGF